MSCRFKCRICRSINKGCWDIQIFQVRLPRVPDMCGVLDLHLPKSLHFTVYSKFLSSMYKSIDPC